MKYIIVMFSWDREGNVNNEGSGKVFVYVIQCGLLQSAIEIFLPGQKVEFSLKTEVGQPPWPVVIKIRIW